MTANGSERPITCPSGKCSLLHDARKCHGHTVSEDGERRPCEAWPIRGGVVCVVHGGRSPQAKAAAGRRLALVAVTAELRQLGHPVDVEPAEAMLAMVHEAAGNVAYYRWKVQSLGEEADGAVGQVAVGRYDDEREKLVRWSKACRDAGVDEKRIELTEQRGALLVAAVRGILTDVAEALGVDVMALPQLGEIVRRHAMRANALEVGS